MEIDRNIEVDPFEVAERFKTEGHVKQVFPFGSGHINDTYKVITTGRNYLLQRVNQQVFMDVRGLTSNMIRVINYISGFVENNNEQMKVLRPVLTLNNSYFFVDEDAGFWRMFDFIQDVLSYDKAENAMQAREGGRAFGWFLRSLDKFNVSSLGETIPGFHNAKVRYEAFCKAIESDRKKRLAEVQAEVDFLQSRAEEMMHVQILAENGDIPVRVTHNDTKINNVLFDEEGGAVCIIDLDTVMPGLSVYDFGDAVRTFANTADEDAKELSDIHMNIEYFTALAEGFLSETKDILNDPEKENLALAAKYITWEQALRFLTDYLKGDLYYKTQYIDHNLVRTRAQIALLKSMEAQYETMRESILKICQA
ncbi:MAG: aminoglycoside phosphotransferase family protein [Bacteroidales bacterium]|nr:aminoglycoside phosphotransferase family protein [Bacteroidales bacterium]